MGLKDLGRGGGNVVSRRRGGSNSALAQRYLAAIDGDAIELVLPSQQQEHQRQPASPSGRSRSSHTTKSTKQTVRTVGCESSDSAWNETPKPTSPARYRRRPLQLQEEQSGRSEGVTGKPEQLAKSIAVPAAQKVSSPDIAHVAASKRGFFPRTLLRNVNTPPTKPDVSRTVVSDRMNSSKVAADSLPQSGRRKPSVSRSSHILEHRRDHNKTDSDESDDGDSSLTSRRTSESKDSPYQSRHRQDYPLEDHLGDNTASSGESSLSYEDDGNEILHHPSQQDYRFYSERSKLSARDSSSKHTSAIPRHTQFSIEKTFDEAFEKGLDMILNTNAWACTVPDSRTSPIPSSTKDTKRINSRSQRNTVMTPPQRRKQRHNALRHSFSAETPRSDVTGAETEIATNRAIDLALKRVREIENDIALSKEQAKRPPVQAKQMNTRASSHVKHVAMKFERSNLEEAKLPLLVCKRMNIGSHRFTDTKLRTGHHPVNNGALNGHFGATNVQSAYREGTNDEYSLDQTRSLSSSVGVEIGDASRSQSKATTALETFVHTKGASMSSSEREKQHKPTKFRQVLNIKDMLSNDGSSNPAEVCSPRQENLPSPTLRIVKASTPLRPLLNGRPPVSENYVSMDPCMSPPRIVRKPQSFDNTSPDPVFCSKSMSLSIHSSQMLSNSPSTHASDDASFQSDDAMFMERGEETSTTSDEKRRQIETEDGNYSIHQSGNFTMQSKALNNQEVSGHTEPTLFTHSDDETSRELEHGSPYLELLGIRGSFPTTPVIERPKSPLQQLSRSSVVNEPNPALMVKSDATSPPPFGDSILIASREYSADTSAAHALESRKETNENCYSHLSGSSSMKNSFHTVFAKPRPLRSAPRMDLGSGGEKCLTSSRFSINNALAEKLSRTGVASQDGDADVRSVDVKSIRSAFESIMSPLEQVQEKDEEDTASVKSLCERYEPPDVSVSLENGITKTRALFEKRSGGGGLRSDAALKTRSGKTVVSDGSVSHEVSPAVKTIHVTNLGLQDDDKESRSLKEVLVDSSFEKKPLSVADRIRAFGGGQKLKPKTELFKSTKVGCKSLTTKNSIPEQIENEPPRRELRETVKLAPKRRMSTFLAFGEKAFLCGPPKELLDPSNIQPGDATNAIPAENLKQCEPAQVEHVSSSSTHFQGFADDNAATADQDSSSHISTLATQPSHDPQFAASQPMWLQHREKILSKSRHSSRVRNAAIESKRETALLLHDSGTSTDIVKSDRCNKDKADTALSGVGRKPCPHFGETNCKCDVVRPETDASFAQVTNDTFLLNSEKTVTHVRKSVEVPKSLIEDEAHESLPITRNAGGVGNETIDQYFADPPPAYKFCRSLSENVKSRSNRTSLMYSSENGCFDQRTKFFERNQSIGFLDGTDEKKEEMSPDFHFPISYSGQPVRYESTSSEISQGFAGNTRTLDQRTEESGPVLVKPVARKPYVRPVPIKPLVDPLSAVPFVRSVSDPTARRFSNNSLSQYCQVLEDETRLHASKSLVHRKYATLALPRLADSDMEPRGVYDDMNSCSEASEFSDGVTLDLSIADVSNLTNPTAIVSKLGGKGQDDNRSESSEGAGEAARKRKEKRNHDLIDYEAKQSEASSSQTSEAAAPLLARALRAFPLSDEVSTDSFFRKRMLVAKQQWNDRLDYQRLESGTENAKEDDSIFNDDLGGIWDIRQVESLFPIATSNNFCEAKRISELDDWQPFSPTLNSDESSRNEDDVLDAEHSSALSRSKTPTRRNTSRIVQPSSQRLAESDISKASRIYNIVPGVNTDPLDSEMSYPLLSTGSSITNPRPSRTVVGQLLSSALSGTASSSNGYSSYMNSGNTASNQSTVSSSTVSNFGAKHSALLARVHALKESRLRRASRMMTPQSNLRPT
jgi:hypothetical protein